MAEQPKITFSVDTHLFRELGELLVGRESTALIELVKNAYDADATEVTVFGEHLAEPARGKISITDNGVGMALDTFTRGFLRIASRLKDAGDRRSVRWSRRFTGSKGVGRLAAHKLARQIDIQSFPWSPLGEEKGRTARAGVKGKIDWDEVEKAETLDAIPDGAVTAHVSKGKVGTTLILSGLRHKWSKTQLSRFLIEVEGLRAPAALWTPLPKTLVPERGLFETPLVVDAASGDPGFTVNLEGAFEGGENYWPAVIETAAWLVEIDASSSQVRYAISPTRRTLADLPEAKSVTLSENHPGAETGPFFQARVLIREGAALGKRDERAWSSRVSGVRVYMEGFRVLPYGEDADDWLSLTRDTTDRTRKLRFLTESTAAAKLQEIEDEGLLLLPSKHYFGAVFLTENRAAALKMLVNREGFLPDAAFETLVALVRRGIDLSTRVRASAKATRITEDQADDVDGGEGMPTGPGVRKRRTLKASAENSFRRLTAQASELEALAKTMPPALAKKLSDAAIEIGRAAQASHELIPATSMILVLASVGTQLAAFTHEVNRLLSMAQDVEASATRLKDTELPGKARSQAIKVLGGASDLLRRAIERQAAYLVDVVTPDARRRRSRLRIQEVLDATWRLVAGAAERRNISIRNEIDEEHKTPPMFRAELMAVFTNLLTNAVKAAGEAGVIRADSTKRDDGELLIRFENTGIAIDLEDSEKWFRPFESTTIDVDPVLGQGMGLGLGIARDLLADVGGTLRFVRPRRGFATALEIGFPATS